MTYTVKPGDTLSGILKKLGVSSYASPQTWALVKTRSGNPSRIYSGEVLDLSRVPGLAPQQASAPAPVAPTAPVVDRATTEGKAATEGTPTLDFKKDVMPWEEFFDENLALSSSAQQAGGYYTPLLQRGREGVESDFASRGLTRSGMRGRSVMDLYKDFAEKEQKMRDQLYGIREGQAKENYGFQQSMYEEDPRGYKPTSYKTEKYEYDYPVESPGKYGQSYRDWIRNTYKI